MKLFDAFSPDVMAELARPVRTFDPRDAEIVDCQPNWYLIEVYEPAQREVEREFVKRRFGIFVPEVETTEIKRGRKITRKSLLFPGYIFLFVWDIARHWSRITRIGGVAQIMTSKPALQMSIETRGKTVDEISREFGLSLEDARRALAEASTPPAHRAVVIDEEVIDQIRALENGERPIARKRTRGKKREHDSDVIGTHAWSAFPDRLLELDSKERNQTLRKALGLS